MPQKQTIPAEDVGPVSTCSHRYEWYGTDTSKCKKCGKIVSDGEAESFHANANCPATSCSARVWHCVGHNPTRWSLIQQTEDDTIGRIDAHATRRKDGSWHYRTTTPDQVGVEPSLDEAIKASNAILQNAGVSHPPKED